MDFECYTNLIRADTLSPADFQGLLVFVMGCKRGINIGIRGASIFRHENRNKRLVTIATVIKGARNSSFCSCWTSTFTL